MISPSYTKPIRLSAQSPNRGFSRLSFASTPDNSSNYFEIKFARSPMATICTTPKKNLYGTSPAPPPTTYSPKFPDLHTAIPKIDGYSYREALPLTVSPLPDSPGPSAYNLPEVKPLTPSFSIPKASSSPNKAEDSHPKTLLYPNYRPIESRLDTHVLPINKGKSHNLDEYLIPKCTTPTEMSYSPVVVSHPCKVASVSHFTGAEARGGLGPAPQGFFSCEKMSPNIRPVNTLVNQANSILLNSRKARRAVFDSPLHKKAIKVLSRSSSRLS
ncbi:hypothetical protein RCL1_001925 [Eukaryota sp. TZLM3-RCL]